MSRPAVVLHYHLPLQSISLKTRQKLSPDQPVHAARSDDGNTDDAVEIVRYRLIDALAVGGWDEGGDGEVHVAEEEEDGDGEGAAEGWIPLVCFSVEVEVDKGAGNEYVDDREGVGDDAIND